MAGSFMNRSPTCLACLRRLAQPFGGVNGSSSTSTGQASLVQIRAKSNRLRPRDQGVVVRLLQDIPKYGRKDSIFRVERGRMRNEWYPKKMAEYMTAERFKELGLTRDNIGERDPTFGTLETDVASTAPEAKQEGKPSTQFITSLDPAVAHRFLTTLVPDTLTFYRKPTPTTPSSPSPVSPLIAYSIPSQTTNQHGQESSIFGSVSINDVISKIKELLAGHSEASRVALEPENVRFVDLEDGTDRIKSLGRWQVTISVGDEMEPIRKVVEVLPEAAAATGIDAGDQHAEKGMLSAYSSGQTGNI